MFKKVSHIAEQTATCVSRRRFLDKFGRGAVAAAAALAGILATPTVVHAGRCCPSGYRCRRPGRGCRFAGCGWGYCSWYCNGYFVSTYCTKGGN